MTGETVDLEITDDMTADDVNAMIAFMRKNRAVGGRRLPSRAIIAERVPPTIEQLARDAWEAGL